MKRVVGIVVAGAFTAGAFGGNLWTSIYNNVPGQPNSLVPGLGGVSWDPGTGTSDFDRVFGSGNGNWALTGFADLGSGEDEVLIVNGVLVQQEGQATEWAPGENAGLIDTRVAINNAGAFAFANNTNGPTAGDEYIVKGPAPLGTVAQEGAAFDASINFGNAIDTPVITADGRIGYVADNVTGANITTSNDELVVLGGTILAQKGVTIPTGQAGGATETFQAFDINDYWVSADGQNWMVQGDLNGDSAVDDVVTVNNNVVIQAGSTVGGLPSPVTIAGATGTFMDAAGNWYARGSNEDGQDWVVRNGDVIAKTGDSVTGGSELWSDAEFAGTFFLQVGNGLGDYIIGGVTDADPASDGVLVLNGTEIVARQGDPVDLDGNGLLDDNAFFDTFGNDDAFLSDDLILYIVATIRDGTGTRIGQGFFSIQVPEPGTLSLLTLVGLAVLRRRR